MWWEGAAQTSQQHHVAHLPHTLMSWGGVRQVRETRLHFMPFLSSLTTLTDFHTKGVITHFSLKAEFRNGAGNRDGFIYSVIIYGALCPKIFIGGSSDKESACQCRKQKRGWFNPWVRKYAWRRAWHPTPVDSITDSVDMNLSKSWETVKDREAWGATVFGAIKS